MFLIAMDILIQVSVKFLEGKFLYVFWLPRGVGQHLEVVGSFQLIYVLEQFFKFLFAELCLATDSSQDCDANLGAFSNENSGPEVLDEWVREKLVTLFNIVFSKHFSEEVSIDRILQIRESHAGSA